MNILNYKDDGDSESNHRSPEREIENLYGPNDQGGKQHKFVNKNW